MAAFNRNKVQQSLALNVILFLQTSTCAFAELPRIIFEHFGDSGQLNLYFCHASDANSFAISATSETTKLMRKTALLSDPEVQKVFLDQDQHRLSIFVDASCPNGWDFVLQNKDQFNSSYRWLIWASDLPTTVELLESTGLDFDSDVTIIKEERELEDGLNGNKKYLSMFDIYRKHKNKPSELREYQRWSEGQVYSIAPLPDREDVDGIVFKGVMMIPGWTSKNVSFEMLTDPSMALGQSVRWRYGISLFLTICQHFMNCSIQPILIQDHQESMVSPNSTANEALGLVNRGLADFGIIPFEWEYDGDESIEYTLPIMNLKHKYLFIRPKMFSTWSTLVRPLSSDVWFLLAGFLVLGVIAFKAVAPYDESAQHNKTWTGCAFAIISAVAQQGIPDNAYKLTTRMICLGILILTYLVWIYYSTALLNGLLLPPPDNIHFTPELFGSLLEVGLEDTLYLRQRLHQNKPLDSTLKQKLSDTSQPEMFVPADVAIEKIVEEPYAFLAEETILNSMLWQVRMTFAEMCSIGLVDDMELPRQASFVHQRNSPYKELLRRGIVRSRERGAMDRLKSDWFPSVPPCLWKQDSKQLGFEPHAIAYIIIILGGIASISILVGEKFTKYWQFGRNCKKSTID